MFEALKGLEKPILITGATGFKGTWLCRLLDELNLDYIGIGLNDRNAHYYSTDNLYNRIHYLDMTNYSTLEKLLIDINPRLIVHMAASSLVLESYKTPFSVFNNNFLSTLNLLEIVKENLHETKVLITTTDKVYKPTPAGKKYLEKDEIWGQDPYSHSKVCVEVLASAYQKLDKIRVKPWVYVARAGNVIGGGDINQDRLFADLGMAILTGKKVYIRNPQHTRPFQYILDVLFGYLHYLESIALEKVLPLALNFASQDDSITVEHATALFGIGKEKLTFLNKFTHLIKENPTLDLDSSLTKEVLGWQNLVGTVEAINLTKQWWEKLRSGSYTTFDATQTNIKDYLTKVKIIS